MGRERALEGVLPLLARLRDPSLTSQVSRRLGIPEEVVLERIREWKPPTTTQAEPEPVTPPPPAGLVPTRDLTHLLWLVVHRYAQVADLLARIDPGLLPLDPVVLPPLARLLSGEPVAGVLSEITDPGLARTLQAVVARAELYGEDQAAEAALQVVGRLVRPGWTAALARARDAYERAARSGDVPASLPLLRELKALQDRNQAFDRALRSHDVDRCVALLAPVEKPPPTG
jgi:hypothetical protein